MLIIAKQSRGNKMNYIKSLTVVFLVLSCLLTGCNESSNLGTILGSSNNFKGISGKFISSNGTPIAKATVKVKLISPILAKIGLDSLVSDSLTTTTGSDGTFQVKVDSGTYDVSGISSDSGLLLYRPNVAVTKVDSNVSLTDTLKPPGAIVVNVKPLAKMLAKISSTPVDLSSGTCYLNRVSPIYPTDSSGTCEIPNVAEGKYQVVLRYPTFTSMKDSVSVVASKITNVSATLSADTLLPPPTPSKIVGLVYDSLSGTIKLNWSHVNVANLAGYTIYQSVSGSALTQVGSTTDTFFVDTLKGIKDSSMLVFKIKSINKNGDQSTLYSVGDSVMTYHKEDFYLLPKKLMDVYDSLGGVVHLTWDSVSNAQYALYLNDSLLKTVKGLGYNDTLNLTKDSTKYIFSLKTEINGTVSTKAEKDSFVVYYKNDFLPLTLTLLGDDSIDVKNPVFSVKEVDGVRSKAVKYIWKIGNIDTVTSLPTVKVLPSKAGTIKVIGVDNLGDSISTSSSYKLFNHIKGLITKDTTFSSSIPFLMDTVTVDSGATITFSGGDSIYFRGDSVSYQPDTIRINWLIIKKGSGLNFKGSLNDSVFVYSYHSNDTRIEWDTTSRVSVKFSHLKHLDSSGSFLLDGTTPPITSDSIMINSTFDNVYIYDNFSSSFVNNGNKFINGTSLHYGNQSNSCILSDTVITCP